MTVAFYHRTFIKTVKVTAVLISSAKKNGLRIIFVSDKDEDLYRATKEEQIHNFTIYGEIMWILQNVGKYLVGKGTVRINT